MNLKCLLTGHKWSEHWSFGFAWSDLGKRFIMFDRVCARCGAEETTRFDLSLDQLAFILGSLEQTVS